MYKYLFLLFVSVQSFILNTPKTKTNLYLVPNKKYPLSGHYIENYLKKLNSKNVSVQTYHIINLHQEEEQEEQEMKEFQKKLENLDDKELDEIEKKLQNELKKDDSYSVSREELDFFNQFLKGGNKEVKKKYPIGNNKERYRPENSNDIYRPRTNKFPEIYIKFPEQETDDDSENYDMFGNPYISKNKNKKKGNKKSENFELIEKSPVNFTDVGGYDNIKKELYQCVDLLSDYEKYIGYNVRVPKGLIFEGPPGNGKTLLAKALAGEANTGFIAVSGSEFQYKYVGVGSSRIRELFKLATDNIPCIIFIDEIDAVGRKRSSDGDVSGNERDSTLNELLVGLDGFKNTSGVFIIGATNRADLLDEALIRPGRIDKRIYISNPDDKTRKAILEIHITGKPFDSSVTISNLVEMTNGLSGAQLENLLNEAMLNALLNNRKEFTDVDIDLVMNKMLAGWQPTSHQFTSDIIDHIAVHELGHAVVGILSKNHAKMKKIVINLSSPKSPAYTVFESSASSILTREALFEHLMILLAGRIAEEIVYGVSVTTGAISDFEEARKLTEKMIYYYGMGKSSIYPSMSEKYKEQIDDEVFKLLNDAYAYSDFLLRNSKELLLEGAELLKQKKVIKSEELIDLMNEKYKSILNLKI
uniref:AAA+ ATPase domain-containing protein n=1 Tax=viral metagenome TaxID=1070528 RepID=A0A6C0DCP8_9ZZZZ